MTGLALFLIMIIGIYIIFIVFCKWYYGNGTVNVQFESSNSKKTVQIPKKQLLNIYYDFLTSVNILRFVAWLFGEFIISLWGILLHSPKIILLVFIAYCIYDPLTIKQINIDDIVLLLQVIGMYHFIIIDIFILSSLSYLFLKILCNGFPFYLSNIFMRYKNERICKYFAANADTVKEE
ncbi:hypothetical protein [Xenorhabdus bovienii]|uniref:hypothetical protein n=1 Tax=Xenorhabdus bovienii TaxID=40576 RepID=UPI0021573C30|nr:hypothetical protein [Xenorhabdus bovienii]